MNKNSEKFFIWGSKGHALVLAEIINLRGGEVIAIADINADAISPIPDLDVIVGDEAYLKWLSDTKRDANFSINQLSAIAAIGGSRGKDRVNYLNKFREAGFKTPSLIHPKSHVSANSEIGSNSQVCAFGFVGVGAIVGDACIINTKASLDHESILGNGVHLGPGATVCGCTFIGDYSFIGAGATILPNLRIGKNCIIGAGTIITKNIPDDTITHGASLNTIKPNYVK